MNKMGVILSKQEKYLEIAREFAHQNGGKLLSTTISNSRSRLLWRCKYDFHRAWETTYGRVVYDKTWCPQCAVFDHDGYAKLLEIAEKRGGKLLSPFYSGSGSKYKWECKFNHIWEAWWISTHRGSWCPYCSRSVSEEICRYVFEQMFNVIFLPTRFEWLVNERGNKLELDGYNAELKLAFEHNGAYHYKEIFKPLHEIQKNDLIKKTLCKQYGITLIVVPQLYDEILPEDLHIFIEKECSQLNTFINKNYILDINQCHKDRSKNVVKEIEGRIREKQGILVKIKFEEITRIIIRCKEGHEWCSSLGQLRDDKWCLQCSGKARHDLNWLQNMASEKEGKCLATEYKNNRTKVQWECRKGHQWAAMPTSIQQGSWCPVCDYERRIPLLIQRNIQGQKK